MTVRETQQAAELPIVSDQVYCDVCGCRSPEKTGRRDGPQARFFCASCWPSNSWCKRAPAVDEDLELDRIYFGNSYVEYCTCGRRHRISPERLVRMSLKECDCGRCSLCKRVLVLRAKLSLLREEAAKE